MSDNGTTRKRNIWQDVAAQVSDHVDLAALELRYETRQARRRLVAIGVMALLVLTGFILLQVAMLQAVMRAGFSLGLAALAVSGVYLLLAGLIFWKFGRRDPRACPPFEATQREINESLKWIQKLFS